MSSSIITSSAAMATFHRQLPPASTQPRSFFAGPPLQRPTPSRPRYPSRCCKRTTQKATVVVARASAAAGSPAAPNPTPSDAGRQLRVAAYIVGWYAFNIMFNILNKTMLNVFPAPWFLSAFQLGASALFMCVLWATGLHPAPRVTGDLLRALIPVAFFHTVGHVSACLSFSQMAVSFTHVVKAAEPVLSVVLAQVVLKETYPAYVWASLLPIIAGCSVSAMKEVSFSWAGFNNAMTSNFGMVLRNIYSKKYLDQFKDIDGINMFALLSIISIAYTLPAALVMEGFANGTYQWGAMAEAGVAALGGTTQFFRLLAGTGLFYHLYNQASYMVLGQGISPVTFSVGNTMKRVAVVVSSVIFFRNPVSPLNWVGSLVAMLGTGLYSVAKQRAAKEAIKK
jgi:solute carrier family 35, member E1